MKTTLLPEVFYSRLPQIRSLKREGIEEVSQVLFVAITSTKTQLAWARTHCLLPEPQPPPDNHPQKKRPDGKAWGKPLQQPRSQSYLAQDGFKFPRHWPQTVSLLLQAIHTKAQNEQEEGEVVCVWSVRKSRGDQTYSNKAWSGEGSRKFCTFLKSLVLDAWKCLSCKNWGFFFF